MPLHAFRVLRVDPEAHLYGHFVIEAESDEQDEILNLLSDQDRRLIGMRLHIISNLDSALPANIVFQLGPAYNVSDLPESPDLTTQSGHKIWIP